MGFKGGFGGFGGGQMQQLVKQAQKMQEDIAKAQEELEEAELVGESGGGLVKVTVSGKKTVKAISISPKAYDPEDPEMLEDLIIAAINSAYEQADAVYSEKMGKYGNAAGGLI